mmetsp:Transcript_16923/g.38670  ORF Transcript_16923/g.38670 Transcript_16923/m.38670 type:complete len:316 (-) Transcript_16923:19-966(-)
MDGTHYEGDRLGKSETFFFLVPSTPKARGRSVQVFHRCFLFLFQFGKAEREPDFFGGGNISLLLGGILVGSYYWLFSIGLDNGGRCLELFVLGDFQGRHENVHVHRQELFVESPRRGARVNDFQRRSKGRHETRCPDEFRQVGTNGPPPEEVPEFRHEGSLVFLGGFAEECCHGDQARGTRIGSFVLVHVVFVHKVAKFEGRFDGAEADDAGAQVGEGLGKKDAVRSDTNIISRQRREGAPRFVLVFVLVVVFPGSDLHVTETVRLVILDEFLGLAQQLEGDFGSSHRMHRLGKPQKFGVVVLAGGDVVEKDGRG